MTDYSELVHVGDVFGRWTVVSKSEPTQRYPHRKTWLCKCECGTMRSVEERNLISGKSKSCGCYVREMMVGNKFNEKVRPHHKDRLYRIWISMRRRCNNPKDCSFYLYGEKGVSVCDEWDNYESFRDWAYGNGYDDKAKFSECTLDRINPFGNYEPKNCRWVSMKVQNNNTRRQYAKLHGLN